MLDILIWSKNRPAQLDLCLRSIYEQFKPDKKIRVQYTFEGEQYLDGYTIVMKKYPDVEFILEKSFKETCYEIISQYKNKYCMFFTDDDVFLKPVFVKDFMFHVKLFESNDKIHTLSLRMNASINFCNPANQDIAPPSTFIEKEKYLLWNWMQAGINQHYCWAYPMSIDSHLYPRERIVNLIKTRTAFYNVNSLESAINGKRWFDKPLILSFKETKVLNVQNNFVQGSRVDESTFDHTIEALNKKFLEGYRISTKGIYGLETQRAHGPIEYKFVKKNKRK